MILYEWINVASHFAKNFYFQAAEIACHFHIEGLEEWLNFFSHDLAKSTTTFMIGFKSKKLKKLYKNNQNIFKM